MEQKNDIGIFQCSNGYIPKNTVYRKRERIREKLYKTTLWLGI
jgi:hypothetical protein